MVDARVALYLVQGNGAHLEIIVLSSFLFESVWRRGTRSLSHATQGNTRSKGTINPYKYLRVTRACLTDLTLMSVRALCLHYRSGVVLPIFGVDGVR